jgi:hypothetical protein
MKRSFFIGLSLLFLQATISPAQERAVDASSACPADVSVCFLTCDTCTPRTWGSTEYLLGWTKKSPVNVPLLTAALDPNDPTAGTIGSPNTAVVLGNESYGQGTRQGMRFLLGAWLDSQATIGIEGSYMNILPNSSTNSQSSNGSPGSPDLRIPFRDAVTNTEAQGFLAAPFVRPGVAVLSIANQLQGAELNVVAKLVSSDRFSLNGLLGFRWVRFAEDLDYTLLTTSGPANLGGSFDSFRATNNFYGGQLGLRGDYSVGNFFVNATGKVALGSVNQVVDVNGITSFPPAFTNAPGGVFALPTNFGHHTHNAFGVVPEGDVKFGYNITRNLQGFVGYNFLYVNNFARPGAVIDRNLNVSQAPGFAGFPNAPTGPVAPVFSFNRSDFWAQGVSIGIAFKF